MSVGLTALGGLIGLFWIATLASCVDCGIDAHAYFMADPLAPYANGSRVLGADAYLYSPVFAQVLEPLRWLGWVGFVTVLRLAELAALLYLAGPLTPLLFLWPPVPSELNAANIHLLLAASAVYGLRHPSAWAFVLLTKVTPGVGLLWFAARGEWRALRTALVVTLAFTAVSVVISPQAWGDWIGSLAYNATNPAPLGPSTPTTISPLLRVPLAAIIVVIAARRGWQWALPGVVTLALPVVWGHALSALVGTWRAWLDRREVRHAGLSVPRVVQPRVGVPPQPTVNVGREPG